MHKLIILGSANSIHTVKWANFFVGYFNNVVIYSFDEVSQSLNPQIKVVKLPKPINFFAFLVWCIKLRKTRKGKSVIHVHSLGSYAFLAVFLRLKNFISTPWGSDLIFIKRNIVKLLVFQYVLKNSTLFTTDSELLSKLLVSKNISKSKIFKINFGVDTDKFKKQFSSYLYDNYNIDKKSPIIISTRSLEPVYDIETLIKAANLLKNDYPQLKIVIAGGGSLNSYLKQLVKNLDLEKNVYFIGPISNEVLPKILNSATIYVSTSLSDAGLAASTAEAMSCELVAIISNIRENNYWITNNQNGYLFDPGNFLDLSRKIRNILINESEIYSIGKKARETILLNNDYKTEMNKVLQIYRTLQNEK